MVLPLLEVLKQLRPDRRVIILQHFDDRTRDQIYEAIMHTLSSEKVPFRKRLFLRSKLLPYKNELRFLADKKRSAECKKKKLAQVGGGAMNYILRAAVPLLLNLYKS